MSTRKFFFFLYALKTKSCKAPGPVTWENSSCSRLAIKTFLSALRCPWGGLWWVYLTTRLERLGAEPRASREDSAVNDRVSHTAVDDPRCGTGTLQEKRWGQTPQYKEALNTKSMELHAHSPSILEVEGKRIRSSKPAWAA